MITEQEITRLETLYRSCRAYHGELHDHSASGGTSDGKCTLAEWTEEMAALHMDFAAILDHRQVRHMYLPEWKDGLFIGGSEPGTKIDDSHAEGKYMHYNMLFTGPEPLEALLAEFDDMCIDEYLEAEGETIPVLVAHGVAVYDPEIDYSYDNLFHRADGLMYNHKRKIKEQFDI